MSFLVNPFQRDNHKTFPGVVIPLSQGHQPSLASPSAKDVRPTSDDDKLAKVGSEENGTSSLPETSILTLEDLRAEIEEDVATSGLDSAYDRMSIYTA
jgi:hypothetical protein